MNTTINTNIADQLTISKNVHSNANHYNINHITSKRNKSTHKSSFNNEERAFLDSLTDKYLTYLGASNNAMMTKTLKTRSSIITWLFAADKLITKNNSAVYTTIAILDKMITIFDYKLSENDIFAITLAGYYLSLKYHYIHIVPIKKFIEAVCHNQITKEKLIATELMILRKLKFKIPKNDDFEEFLVFLCENTQKTQNEHIDRLKHYSRKLYHKYLIERPRTNYNALGIFVVIIEKVATKLPEGVVNIQVFLELLEL